MSTLTAPAITTPLTARADVPPRSSFAGIMRGEWIKLLSLRSTWWTLAVTAALMPLVSLAAASSLGAMADDPLMAPALAEMHGAEVISGAFQIAMVSIAVLGALFITGEYSTGMIRSTFAAVPTRLPVLAAKAIALVVLTTAVTVVGAVLSYLVTMPALSQHDLVPPLDDSGTWRVLAGTVFFLVAARAVLPWHRDAPALDRGDRHPGPDRAAGPARRTQLHQPRLGRDNRQLPAAACLLGLHRRGRNICPGRRAQRHRRPRDHRGVCDRPARRSSRHAAAA